MWEVKNEQVNRRHDEAAYSRTASSSLGNGGRSDMVRRPTNPAFALLSTLALPDRLATPDLPSHNGGFILKYERQRPVETHSSQINQILSSINSLPAILQRDVTQTKVLNTQIPNLVYQIPNTRGSKQKFNEFEHFLLKHLRPQQYMTTEENNIRCFQNLLKDEINDWWKTLRIH